MRDLSSVADTLRQVRKARKQFLELWAVEKNYVNPMLDRMAEDLNDIPTADRRRPSEPQSPASSGD